MATKKKTTSRKKEIFMGFKLDAPRAEPPKSNYAGRSKKAPTPVFEKARETVLHKLGISIDDSIGRYGGSDEHDPQLGKMVERKADPAEKAYRSVYWTVRHTPNEHLLDEQCEIAIRVGQSLWSCFEPVDGVKDSDKRYLVTADMLTPTLEQIKAMIEGLDKDSPEGKSFHKLAIESAGRRNKGKYNSATDLFE